MPKKTTIFEVHGEPVVVDLWPSSASATSSNIIWKYPIPQLLDRNTSFIIDILDQKWTRDKKTQVLLSQKPFSKQILKLKKELSKQLVQYLISINKDTHDLKFIWYSEWKIQTNATTTSIATILQLSLKLKIEEK